MSKLRVRCPQGHLLEVEVAHAGKQVQCPLCQTILRIPELPRAKVVTTAHSPAPLHQEFREEQQSEDEEYEEEVRPKKSGTKAGLKKVKIGLNYQIAQLYVKVIGGVALGLLAYFLVRNNPAGFAQAPGQVSGIVTVLSVIVSLVSMVLGILSSIYILGIPEPTRAKGLAIGFLVLVVIESLCGITANLVDSPGLILVLGFINSVFAVSGYICFILLLKRLCEFIKKDKLAAKAGSLLIMLGAIIGCYLIMFLCGIGIVAAVGANQVGGMGILAIVAMLAGLAVFVLVIWSFFRYLGLLQRVRDVL